MADTYSRLLLMLLITLAWNLTLKFSQKYVKIRLFSTILFKMNEAWLHGKHSLLTKKIMSLQFSILKKLLPKF